MKQLIILSLKLAIAASLIAWLVTTGRLDLSQFSRITSSLYLALLFASVFGVIFAQSERWFALLKAQQVDVGRGLVYRAYLMSLFFQTFTPGIVGSDAVRGYHIYRDAPDQRLAAAATVIVDRGLSLFGFMLFGSLAFVFLYNSTQNLEFIWPLGLLCLTSTAGASIGGLLLLRKTVRAWLLAHLPTSLANSLRGSIERYSANYTLVARAIAFSLMACFLTGAAFMLGSYAAGVPISTYEIFFALPFVIIANSVPISFGGLGVGEAAASTLFASFGLQSGAIAMLLFRMALWTIGIVGGGVCFILDRPRHHTDLRAEGLLAAYPPRQHPK